METVTTSPRKRTFTYGQVITWDDLYPRDLLVHWVYGRRDTEVFLLHEERKYLVCLVRYVPSRAWVVLDVFDQLSLAVASAMDNAF